MKLDFGVMALAILLGGCASTAPDANPAGKPVPEKPDLACLIPTQCVNSMGTGDLAPLQYTGTPAQGLALLRDTLATFPEAKVVHAEPLALEAIFTTTVGFRDQVDFRIDAQAHRIDFRSRSMLGLFDFGKNRSRMQQFATRFEQQTQR